MGVQHLMRLIYENARNAVSEARVATYRNKRVAIDANIYVYKCMAQRPFYTGRHIVRMLRLARWLRRREIEPLFVFDNQSSTLSAKTNERFARRARKRRNVARHEDVLRAIATLRHVRERCVHLSRVAQHTYVDERTKSLLADALLFALEDAEHAFLPRKLVQRCASDLCSRVETATRVRNRKLAPLHTFLRCATLLSSERDWIDIDLTSAGDSAQHKQILATFCAMCERPTHFAECAPPPQESLTAAPAHGVAPTHANNSFAQQNIFLDRDGALFVPERDHAPSTVTFCALHFESPADIPTNLSALVERCWERLLNSLRAAENTASSTPTLPALLPVLYCSMSRNAADCTVTNIMSTCFAPRNAQMVSQLDSAIKIHCAQRSAELHATPTAPNTAGTATTTTTALLQSENSNSSTGNTSQCQTERSLRRIFATLTNNLRLMTDSQSVCAASTSGLQKISADQSSSDDTTTLMCHFGGEQAQSLCSSSDYLKQSQNKNDKSNNHTSTCTNNETNSTKTHTVSEAHCPALSATAHIGKRLVRHTSSSTQPPSLLLTATGTHAHFDRLKAALDAQGGAWSADGALLTALLREISAASDTGTPPLRAERKPLLHRTRQCQRKRTISALHDVAHHTTSLDHALHRLAWLAVSLEAQTVRVHYDQVDQVKHALTLAGESVIEAPHEAEQHCSRLCASDAVYAVMSDDTDVVPFGARRVLRKCRFAHNATGDSVFAQAIDCDALRRSWRMTRAQLVDLCILIGCDFCAALRDVSARRVFHCFAQNQCSLERTLQALPPHCVAPLCTEHSVSAIARARAIFLGTEPPKAASGDSSEASTSAKKTNANREELRRFLIEQECLHRAREFLPRQKLAINAAETLSASFDDTAEQ